MSNYDAFLEEKLKIDDLLSRGYTITGTRGTLDGDILEFEKIEMPSDRVTILLKNPDSRKYFTTLYLKQREKV
ncbi:MAG TPA: hypothetical protein DEO65_01540 [Bacillus bacterium]|uniref:Uncharacterized protein n=1 Tax=Siminovitchia fordii TaxID=254759 RepID=A0ABQ4K562_9BACI|nr:hypothetical protein [Siminovitchia fordii]GIN20866.1 hypothetical protein J1TS3_20000 [Siminovitchia fordii]HBZ08550.1 hypothetical protein [Bacillus sp. (in: firmicutes)]